MSNVNSFFTGGQHFLQALGHTPCVIWRICTLFAMSRDYRRQLVDDSDQLRIC